ncbi:MAG: outer membrane lipoprotein-sorting protein [Pseudomonadales bacterium]|nr:outer membrane lipoprotein-sorting protein [Pseudomonadales bacterium]
MNKTQNETFAREMVLLSGKAKMRTERKFTSVNDRLSTFLTPHGSKMALVQRSQNIFQKFIRSIPGITLAAWVAVGFATISTNASAADLTDVNKIVNKANLAAFYSGADGRAETRMQIVDSQGRKQTRQFTILRRDYINDGKDGGDQQYLVLFSYPSDIRGTLFLVEKHPGGDDDRWLYLPGLDLVKRIASGDKRTSFVGSDFFYEDVSGRGLSEDHHKLIETTDKFYVVLNTPKNPSNVEFVNYQVWIDKKTFMPVKTEYTDNAGKIYRRIEALQVKTIQGFPTATRMKVSNLRTGGYTLNEMRFISYDLGMPADIFSERSLRNPPRQWFKRPAAK